MTKAVSELDPHKVKTLARAMWALEWKLQNPGASNEAREACWKIARKQQTQTAKKLLADLGTRGFVLTPKDPE